MPYFKLQSAAVAATAKLRFMSLNFVVLRVGVGSRTFLVHIGVDYKLEKGALIHILRFTYCKKVKGKAFTFSFFKLLKMSKRRRKETGCKRP